MDRRIENHQPEQRINKEKNSSDRQRKSFLANTFIPHVAKSSAENTKERKIIFPAHGSSPHITPLATI